MTDIFYFDFQKTGIPDVNKDIALVTNSDAILDNIFNIISTQPTSRIYGQRSFGCDLNQFLFEPIDNTTSLKIFDTINLAIKKQEPRARNLSISIKADPDNNDFDIVITVIANQADKIFQLQTTLRKIR